MVDVGLIEVGVLLVVVCMWFLRRRDPRLAGVLVVGDLGHSPRMLYHATSLVQHGWKVRLIGYLHTDLPASLQCSQVECVLLNDVATWFKNWPRAFFPLVALIKVPLTAWSIWYALALRTSPCVLFVQTPPAIPSLLVSRISAILCGISVIIDWHNLGYTILSLKLGAAHPLVKLAEWLERWTGKYAYAHLFVTDAMKRYLEERWNLSGMKRVLHDRPGPQFQAIDSEVRDDYRRKFAALLNDQHLHEHRALVLTSTSWTPDEDMDMLLRAMSLYNSDAKQPSSNLPPISLVITGKGPLRSAYEAKFRQCAERENWTHVNTTMAWLAVDDYPRLLGCVDVGLSLHTSSSNLDLPMKVVDMLGCHVPVCALNFACLHELIKPDVNGVVFSNASELATSLTAMLRSYPHCRATELHSCGFLPGTPSCWTENWDLNVLPLLPIVQDPSIVSR
ncbi:chitobiosyldiphosphodolichol beta-mannosyltransferase [Malassezia psittaci]|uniref:Chitobiosyldiphosphodolichol beta-mannosyltransferase n=1 Tax=Malassezia psittaci TaxID=1821823 RepID=A0AAF0F6B8_9BASI|nr:chitobiosyldiphosphodolichol beta-mannosyltransferase [Malassezia psittaci]